MQARAAGRIQQFSSLTVTVAVVVCSRLSLAIAVIACGSTVAHPKLPSKAYFYLSEGKIQCFQYLPCRIMLIPHFLPFRCLKRHVPLPITLVPLLCLCV